MLLSTYHPQHTTHHIQPATYKLPPRTYLVAGAAVVIRFCKRDGLTISYVRSLRFFLSSLVSETCPLKNKASF